MNAERSAESLFNLLDGDGNGDINEEEFIRLVKSTAKFHINININQASRRCLSGQIKS